MTWKTIRLELAATDAFPKGSASRAYLLRLPLDAAGCIDRHAVERDPTQATMQRFWASEPDVYGHVEERDGQWVFRARRKTGDVIFRLGATALRPTEQVTVEEPCGKILPFRVASVKGLPSLSSSLL